MCVHFSCCKKVNESGEFVHLFFCFSLPSFHRRALVKDKVCSKQWTSCDLVLFCSFNFRTQRIDERKKKKIIFPTFSSTTDRYLSWYCDMKMESEHQLWNYKHLDLFMLAKIGQCASGRENNCVGSKIQVEICSKHLYGTWKLCNPRFEAHLSHEYASQPIKCCLISFVISQFLLWNKMFYGTFCDVKERAGRGIVEKKKKERERKLFIIV